MNLDRFQEITGRYPSLRIAVAGDFCLDRYLEIDSARAETSIETGLPVYNVVKVRAQPGAAGTILNNLVALGIGELHLVGFCGEDGEGYELRRALQAKPRVHLDHFQISPDRRTFTYCKPLIIEEGQPPHELNRLDSKNWTRTPETLDAVLAASIGALAEKVDAIILMDQVDVPGTGVVTSRVREAAHRASKLNPRLLVLADSRTGLGSFPPVAFKMNAVELASLLDERQVLDVEHVRECAVRLARRNGQPVFVTLAERGMVAAMPDGCVSHVPSLPVRGAIDIVGAGDSVTANLTAALAARASAEEAMELAMAGASVVIHQLGTTGEAGVADLCAMVTGGGAGLLGSGVDAER